MARDSYQYFLLFLGGVKFGVTDGDCYKPNFTGPHRPIGATCQGQKPQNRPLLISDPE